MINAARLKHQQRTVGLDRVDLIRDHGINEFIDRTAYGDIQAWRCSRLGLGLGLGLGLRVGLGS